MTRHEPNHWLLNMTDPGAYGAGGRSLPVAVRGDGAFVELTGGRRYIDGPSSMFCNQLGHAHAGELASVAARQMRELSFVSRWASAHCPVPVHVIGDALAPRSASRRRARGHARGPSRLIKETPHDRPQ